MGYFSILWEFGGTISTKIHTTYRNVEWDNYGITKFIRVYMYIVLLIYQISIFCIDCVFPQNKQIIIRWNAFCSWNPAFKGIAICKYGWQRLVFDLMLSLVISINQILV